MKPAKTIMELRPIVRDEKIVELNPRVIFRNIFYKVWIFDSWLSKSVFVIGILALVYSLLRIIWCGVWC